MAADEVGVLAADEVGVLAADEVGVLAVKEVVANTTEEWWQKVALCCFAKSFDSHVILSLIYHNTCETGKSTGNKLGCWHAYEFVHVPLD